MPRRATTTDELFTLRKSWGYLLAKTDPDIGDYVGAPQELMPMIVRIKIIKSKFIPLLRQLGVLNELQEILLSKLLEIRLEYLKQMNKAFFASLRAGELTQLGMFLATAIKTLQNREELPEEELPDGVIIAGEPEA